MIMLVKLADPKQRKRRLLDMYFTFFTVAPWAAMIWLLWPRR